MPNLSGIEAAQRINAALPNLAVVILSMHSDEGYVLRALKAGAKGYILKDSAEGDLFDPGDPGRARGGKTFFSPEDHRNACRRSRSREVRARGAEDRYDLLTAREREDPAQLLAERKSAKEIAASLHLSPLHGGNASAESAGEARFAQPGGPHPIRGAKRTHFLNRVTFCRIIEQSDQVSLSKHSKIADMRNRGGRVLPRRDAPRGL